MKLKAILFVLGLAVKVIPGKVDDEAYELIKKLLGQ
ncbi:hypothetical protein SEA_NICHOLAS_25 [Mycobacterium phage Nicholas]|nr:hypothetical protein AVU96_gp025 [Mycobacterium phage Snenia]YP_009202412.1 hypothetical protein AVU99_gp025 [Mycobacterium phage Lolly9]YP_010012483.1 hypothetical protein J4T93_gp025 [Mycobacterium phage Lumos]YP_010012611.1 hypothetical protein J4T94_gp025 [Mycobacterium phage Krypton555]ASM62763.1 hypothetical protein SEA_CLAUTASTROPHE_25 [Mycobacterium phage Clautastrophe]ASR86955.1 hypothetical protein SEA_KINGSOLOMON_25 [Mycobacterium phage Kingsolomon]ASR87297.1 hypothetical protei